MGLLTHLVEASKPYFQKGEGGGQSKYQIITHTSTKSQPNFTIETAASVVKS